MGRPWWGGPRVICRGPLVVDGVGGEWGGRVHGGMKFYRGAAPAARAYVEADRSRADDYYLAEGSGVADAARRDARRRRATSARWTARPTSSGWPATTSRPAQPKGRLRTDDEGGAVRRGGGQRAEDLVAGGRAAPGDRGRLDAAQDRAASEIIGWLAEHATTRVGPRGRQVQVPVEQIEAAVVRHYTSRAGDPHRHLHLQINARVCAAGSWRGLHTVGVRDSLEAINGIGHAAVATDPEFRAALAAHGYTLDPDTGEIAELAPYVGAFSARAAQIGRNIDRYEAEWRAEHPGEEPGPGLRRGVGPPGLGRGPARQGRPRPTGPTWSQRWVEELRGARLPRPGRARSRSSRCRSGGSTATRSSTWVLSRLGARRSAWNAADIRGEVEGLIAAAQRRRRRRGPARAGRGPHRPSRSIACVPLLTRDDVPEHVRP